MRKALLSLLFACCVASSALAVEAPPAAENPEIEARLNRLSEDLRCLVCQNQNLADSHAELAQDLKREIREMLQKGMSDKEVVDFLVQRYGDFVLYRPPLKGITLLLWGGPFLLLFGGLATLILKLRRRPPAQPLSAEEHALAEAVLKGGEKKQ
ncbi:MAG TPA: cytochrome c-type biogenesis protein [Rhodocyclaceae bacterium]